MSIENVLGDMLSQLRGERVVGFETVSDQVARGIDQSALLGVVKAQGGSVEAGLAGLAAALGVAVTEICSELRQSNRFLGDLTNATLHPLETAAREQYRRGIHALERGWSEESVTFFKQAIEKSPVSPEIWFSLALAQIATEAREDAQDSLERAIKYSIEDSPGVAAGAFLTLAGLQVDNMGTLSVLWRGADVLPTCAEIHFSLARHSANSDSLAEALRIAPELAVMVRLAVPALADRVPEILRAPDGPVIVAKRLRSNITLFGGTFNPAVQVRWVNPEGVGLDGDALAAAETFTYVRTHLSDLWSLGRYGLAAGQRGRIQERSTLANGIAAAAGGLRRVRPWQPLDPDPQALKPSTHRVLRLLTSPNGLVVPGGHPGITFPGQFFVDISGELLALLERGDLPGAVLILRSRHPELDQDGVENILHVAVERLWGA